MLLSAAVQLLAGAAWAADLDAPARADLKRAVAAVGFAASEEPAVRGERLAREPSPGFMAGAALGAWINAAAQLAFDLKNPSGAGPPHVSQTGQDPDAFAQDCADEKAAFDHLDGRRQALGLQPQQILGGAGIADPAVLAAWRTRQSGAAAGCR